MIRNNRVAIRFGTDGWRARIADDFTFDNARTVAQAIADYVNRGQRTKDKGQKKLIVGYDRRFMSDIYAKVVSEVLAANRIKVLIADEATPTPAITFAIKKKRLSGGVIITASHNPWQFNGIKFKTHLAAPAGENATSAIERLIGKHKAKTADFYSALKAIEIEYIDASRDYVKFLRGYVDLSIIDRARLKILVDYMHGAAAGYLEKVLADTSCKIEALRDNADPLFGGVNPEPIPKNLGYTAKYIKTKKFDLGVALDGDGDRIGAIRPDARCVTSGEIISLILLHLLQDKEIRGCVVKTISGTSLIEEICRHYRLKLFETPVGFKHIADLMMREDVIIGGEESGGIGFCNYIPERDGILSALLLIEMVSQRREPITSIMDKLQSRYGRFCYDRLDILYPCRKAEALMKRLRGRPPAKIAGKRIVRIKTYDGIKFIMDDSSWLLLRFSGTEPLIRIYAESHSQDGVRGLLMAGKRLIG